MKDRRDKTNQFEISINLKMANDMKKHNSRNSAIRELSSLTVRKGPLL